jgi:hypothetical protein
MASTIDRRASPATLCGIRVDTVLIWLMVLVMIAFAIWVWRPG